MPFCPLFKGTEGPKKSTEQVLGVCPPVLQELVLCVPFLHRSCKRVGPVQGSKSPKSGKEGFRVRKPPFPHAPEKGDLSQKIPISLQGSTRKMGIFRLKVPFSGALGNGSFLTLKPSFPGFGDFDPCAGPTRSQHRSSGSCGQQIQANVQGHMKQKC